VKEGGGVPLVLLVTFPAAGERQLWPMISARDEMSPLETKQPSRACRNSFGCSWFPPIVFFSRLLWRTSDCRVSKNFMLISNL
jgi:hypothetical protein